MTRINLVPPAELTGKHLVAEYRELPRAFKLILGWQHRCQVGDPEPGLPPAYTLGKGHVRFFYNKARWLIDRQFSLILEMIRRGYEPSFRDPESLATGIDWSLQQTELWVPSSFDLLVSRTRIKERLSGTR